MNPGIQKMFEHLERTYGHECPGVGKRYLEVLQNPYFELKEPVSKKICIDCGRSSRIKKGCSDQARHYRCQFCKTNQSAPKRMPLNL